MGATVYTHTHIYIYIYIYIYSGRLGWCNGEEARQANLHECVRVSLDAPLVCPCATFKQKDW